LTRYFAIVFIFFISFASFAQDDIEYNEDSTEVVRLDSLNSNALLIDSIANTTDFSAIVTTIDEQLLAERINGLVEKVKIPYRKPVKGFVEYFTVRNRNYIRVMLNRKDLYFPIFEKYLKEYNMPDELKYLAIVESGLNPKARSFMGAVGLWQFMPFTGKTLDLSQNAHIDERMDPEKATIAACKYLKQLYGMHGSWELAIAAYNCGPGNVRKAIRQAGGRKDIWTVYNYLPKETKGYVPSFMAVKYAMTYHAAHGIFADTLEHLPKYGFYTVKQFLNIEALANEIGLCADDILNLNPELRTIIVPEHIRNYKLRVPIDKLDELYAKHCEIGDVASCADPNYLEEIHKNYKTESSLRKPVQNGYYVVKSGDNLGKIAAKYKVTVSQLISWNKLDGTFIKPGLKLIVSKSVASKTSYANSKGASNEKGAKYHTVQTGDTLWNISKKYEGLTVEDLKRLNNLDDNSLKVGQKLRIG
jgi:membrane-bound lytic murein transglycosylase D